MPARGHRWSPFGLESFGNAVTKLCGSALHATDWLDARPGKNGSSQPRCQTIISVNQRSVEKVTSAAQIVSINQYDSHVASTRTLHCAPVSHCQRREPNKPENQ